MIIKEKNREIKYVQYFPRLCFVVSRGGQRKEERRKKIYMKIQFMPQKG